MPKKTIGLLIGGLTALAALFFTALMVLPTSPLAAQTTEPITITNTALYQRLRGYIILRVQSKGEAYYIHPHKMEMYYLGRPSDMFRIMKEQGVGITNKDLSKIRDGGIANNTASYDLSFSKKQAGRILLQVQNKGEAWYVSPKDFKRYYLGRPQEAFDIVRHHAIGISEKDFQALTHKEEPGDIRHVPKQEDI